MKRRGRALSKRYGRAKRELSVFDRHQLKIARDTLKMPDAMVGVMGGPSKEEAREIIRRLTGKAPKGHARRARVDPTAWRSTPEGHAKYVAAREEAQKKANELGYDYGLEANDLFKSFHVFMLPSAPNRSGHELRCEVVHPTLIANTKPGHGPVATRETMRGVFYP